jgi:CRP-like cAMP-binding protein
MDAMVISANEAPSISALPILEEAKFFSDLTHDQLERIAAICGVQEFPNGSQIYNLGNPAKYFYVLIDGIVRFNLTLGNRQASAGEFIRRGEVFGWAALIENAQRRIATASCMTACTVLRVEGDQLLQLMEQDHSIGYYLMKKINVLITSKMTAFAAG